MPLRFVSEPRDGSKLVRDALQRQATRKSPLALHAADATALALRTPHAVYDLRADEVAAGKGLESAHATSIRYLVQDASGAVAAAEVHTDDAGSATLVANLNYGQFVQASAKALDRLEQAEQARNGSYEARLLRFAALPVVAIWLKSDAPANPDLIYPLSPAPAPLVAETLIAAGDFLKAIIPLAKERASQPPDSALGGA
jgi:hypothetical protein